MLRYFFVVKLKYFKILIINYRETIINYIFTIIKYLTMKLLGPKSISTGIKMYFICIFFKKGYQLQSENDLMI